MKERLARSRSLRLVFLFLSTFFIQCYRYSSRSESCCQLENISILPQKSVYNSASDFRLVRRFTAAGRLRGILSRRSTSFETSGLSRLTRRTTVVAWAPESKSVLTKCLACSSIRSSKSKTKTVNKMNLLYVARTTLTVARAVSHSPREGGKR